MTGQPIATDVFRPIATAAFRPIGLDDLVARASLLTRVDRKYLVAAADLPLLFDGLAGNVRMLQIDGRREFGYRSVYFDTPDLDSYLATAHSRRRRFKIRIRSYLDTGAHFVEVKTRGRRGTTVKHRFPYTGDALDLDPDARARAGAVLAEAGIPVDGRCFVRVLSTYYRRATLFDPDTGGRVTIDTGLAWALPDGTAIRLPHRVVVETKSHQGTSAVDRLLWSIGHRPVAVSKYATGLAALRPDLRANRWHRVLRHHFDTIAEERSA